MSYVCALPLASGTRGFTVARACVCVYRIARLDRMFPFVPARHTAERRLVQAGHASAFVLFCT